MGKHREAAYAAQVLAVCDGFIRFGAALGFATFLSFDPVGLFV